MRFVLDCGHAVAAGPIADVLTPDLLHQVWNVHAQFVPSPTGRPDLLAIEL